MFAEIAIGISVDEIGRARDADVRYVHNTFPLLDLGRRRNDCLRYLDDQGLADTPRSSTQPRRPPAGEDAADAVCP